MSEEDKVEADNETQPEETVNDDVEETTEEEPEVEVEETEPEDEPEKTEEEPEAEEPEEDPKPEKQERKIFTMTVSKAQKEKKRAVEKATKELEATHKAEIEELKANQSKSEPEDDSELIKFAEDQGMDLDAVKKLVGFVQKPLEGKLSKLNELTAEQEKETEIAKVHKEFDDQVSSLIQKDFPSATAEHISKVKEEVAKLAFTEEYHTYKLADIYKVNKSEFEFKDNYSVEPSDGNGAEIIDFSKITPAEEHKLAQNDPEQFAKLVKYQEANQSRYIDVD